MNRTSKFVSCIEEMEETEEILKVKWQEIQTSGSSRGKSGIEKLFTKLKERQSITSAALQALDTYERLQGERSEFREREQNVFSAFQKWLAQEEGDGGSVSEGELDEDEAAVMRTYAQFRKLSRTFASKWTHIRKADKKVAKELKSLNSSLTSFPRQLGNMQHRQFQKVKWPNSQTQKVSAAVEFAFDQINFITNLLTKIDQKLGRLEVIFKLHKNEIEFESRESGSESEEEELPNHSEDDDMEED